MKHWEIIIESPASTDIDEAHDWIADRDKDAADRWFEAIYDTIATLQSFPERCPLAPENKFFAFEIRELLHGRRQHKYRILFTVAGNRVHVLHVRHGARLWLGQAESDE